MSWVLLVTIILGGQSYPQPAKYFDTKEECEFWIPKDQSMKSNLQIIGSCHQVLGEVNE